jgi:hypothetical protein
VAAVVQALYLWLLLRRHWHFMDGQSFPMTSQRFPELSGRGSYAPEATYTHVDVAKVIEYARVRAVRVMPGEPRSRAAGLV